MTDLQKLLRLKRYEQPPPDYFARFLEEFHERQRTEIIRQPLWRIAWERLVSAIPDFHVPRMAYATVVAAALVVSTVIVVNQDSSPATGPLVAQAPVVEPTAFALNSSPSSVTVLPSSVSADVVAPANRATFPPHYVLEARPVSYESPYSF